VCAHARESAAAEKAMNRSSLIFGANVVVDQYSGGRGEA
jgi:hypothetical protein